MRFRPMFRSIFSFDAYNEAGRTGIGPTQVRKWETCQWSQYGGSRAGTRQVGVLSALELSHLSGFGQISSHSPDDRLFSFRKAELTTLGRDTFYIVTLTILTDV